MRRFLLAGAVGLALASNVLAPAAKATLVGQFVITAFYFGSFSSSSPNENEGAQKITASGAHFSETDLDGSTIDVSGTQIIITNNLQTSQPYCSTQLPCSDTFTGFDFKFSVGAEITRVTVDPSSNFFPSAGTPPFITIQSPTEFTVNLTGDAPAPGQELILNINPVVVPPPTSVPEPFSLTLLGAGLLGSVAMRRRCRRTQAAVSG